ncbi:putative copper chaperone SCO1/SenC [Helianthus anomalus]
MFFFCFFFLTCTISKHNIKVQLVFVGIDPQRDTPSHLRAHLKSRWQMSIDCFFKKAEEDGDGYLFESSHIYSLGHETRHGCGVTYI